MKRWLLLCCLLLGLLPLPAQAAARIDTVRATVTAENNLPPLVRERMEKSVQTIADQLLNGKTVSEAAAAKTAEENLIQEVFDKVLVGYTVQSVTIVPDEQTRVQVNLLPWANTIQKVDVQTSVEGMPANVDKLVRADAKGIEQVFDDALIGLPTAATDWTNGVLKHHLQDYLSAHLPEFRGDFELVPGPTAKVSLVLYPRLPVVRTVDLSMRSDTMPNVTLLGHRQLMQQDVDSLVGVPVAFVARHHADFEQAFAKDLDAQTDFKAFAMQTKVTITADERMKVMSRSDTSRYRLRLTGWQDIGRGNYKHHDSNDNLLFRLHAGAMLSQKDELFGLLDVMPNQMNWDWQLGFDHRFGMPAFGTHGTIRYDMRAHRFVFGAEQPIFNRLSLRYEYRVADKLGEFGLRYQLHDFLSLEYVFDREDNWLRLIGNF